VHSLIRKRFELVGNGRVVSYRAQKIGSFPGGRFWRSEEAGIDVNSVSDFW